jgi:SHAQKYF class myb-like DNA-binding protein
MNKFSTDLNNISPNSLDNTDEGSLPIKQNNQSDRKAEESEHTNEGNYNTGRWSQDEHKKFIEAIIKYGNEWKKIKEFIGSRSSTQARSHAQKFFIRLKKKLFEKKLIINKQNYDQNSISNVITCFQDCLPSKKMNMDESEKLMKMIIALTNENKIKEEKNAKIMTNFKINEHNKKELLCKKRFFIEKINKNKDSNKESHLKGDPKIQTISTISELENLKNNIEDLVFLRRMKVKKRIKIKTNKKNKNTESNTLSQIKQLQNNLIKKQIDRVFINNERHYSIDEPLVVYEKYHVDKSSNIPKSQGVFEDLQRYYRQLYNISENSGRFDLSNEDSNTINCPIEQINIESMFNNQNPYYTHNEVEINNDINI